MIKRIASILVKLATATNSDDNSTAEATALTARSLLGLVHQRHFDLLRDIADHVLEDSADTSETGGSDGKKRRKKRTNELLASFSLVRTSAIPVTSFSTLMLCTRATL